MDQTSRMTLARLKKNELLPEIFAAQSIGRSFCKMLYNQDNP